MKDKRVCIAGIGGIGSNIARILTASGVTCLRIIDFDVVEASNLNRQFYFYDQIGELKTDMLEINLKRINPGILIEKRQMKLTPSTISEAAEGCRVVVEGVDTIEDKKMIMENFAGEMPLMVSASGIAGQEMEGIRVKRLGRGYVVGDLSSDDKDFPLFPPKIHLVASTMAGIVLSYLLHEKEEEK